MSMPVLIGMLMLFGIVAKNSILLVDFAIEEMDKGVPKNEAIIEAGHKRAQPIVMTTVAMVAGMVPTALSLSGDASWRAPMGDRGDRRPDPLDAADAGDRAGRLQPRRSASRSGSGRSSRRLLTYTAEQDARRRTTGAAARRSRRSPRRGA